MTVQAEPTESVTDDVLLAVRDLTKHFPIREGALQRVTGHVRAVDGVSFELRRGQTLGLVGESGCGKTTLGRLVAGLIEPTAGGVFYKPTVGGPAIEHLEGQAWRSFRRNCQMVFQDSFASLNPRHLVKDIVGRPLKVYNEASGPDLIERTVELLEQVGLGRQHLYRYPHQFSGGQRQRISIARALALDPELVVLDEPTSALDVSVQAQILNLLHELQDERGLSYLFVTHDLSVVRHMAEDIVVMYLGRMVETGPTEGIFAGPHHPYTHALLQASPDVDADVDGFHGLEGAVPDPARPPQGCRFHTRCEYAVAVCGWEIDDVVRRLEDIPGMFDNLEGVERRSPFDADLRFGDETAAAALAAAFDTVPPAMQDAVDVLQLDGNTVSIRFNTSEDVTLESRGAKRHAACVLEDFAATR